MNKFETQQVFFYKFLIHHLMKCKSLESIKLSIFEKLYVNSSHNDTLSEYRFNIYLNTTELKSHHLFLSPSHDFLFKKDWCYLNELANNFEAKITLMAHQNHSTSKLVLIDKKTLNSSENLFFAQLYEKHYCYDTDGVVINIDKKTVSQLNYQNKKESLLIQCMDDILLSQYEHNRFDSRLKQKTLKKIKKL
jgi:hypothetical protein